MNPSPIIPAELGRTTDGLPCSPRYRDIYHPAVGALQQARHVFLRGNELPARWRSRARFVVLETGFGLGNNFLATWQAWRDDPQRCAQLCFISIEQHPLTHADLAAVHRESELPELADALLGAWPPLTPNLHRLDFEAGRVQLLLALGDVQAWLPELVAQVDAFYLDGFTPATNPRMWDARVCKALGRLAAPGATLATWSAARALRRSLAAAGFEATLAPGIGAKRDITLARYAPRHAPRRAAARVRADAAGEPSALIVGAGLAGCATAWALAEQGWQASVFDRRSRIAAEASGNPAGIFHGTVHAQDGVHARLHRAAALAARDAVQVGIDGHGVAGCAQGLLRLESKLDHAQMQAILERQGLPPDYVQVLDAPRASACAGIELTRCAWFYPTAGWVDPAGLARSFLERAGPRAQLHVDVDVRALRRGGSGWCLLDAQGSLIAEAPTVVLTNAADALRLLGMPDWPIESIRGQISSVEASASRLTLPRLPVAGAGYVLPQVDGRTIFGATAHSGDLDGSVRLADHAANLAQLARLIGHSPGIDALAVQGRTGWRCSARDRLPVIGPVPEDSPARPATRLDQPRFVPRIPGLFTFTALGSRGITWSALGAQLVASLITGAPVPLEAGLIDALDPARFMVRRARRLKA